MTSSFALKTQNNLVPSFRHRAGLIGSLQRMQVNQQIINLLLRQRSTEVGHVFAA